MSTKPTFAPQRSFADHYEGLVKMLMEKAFLFSHININQCLQDTIAQREERANHDALEAKYREAHARFAVNQRERFGRYIRLLDAARAAFRDDKAMLAALRNFARRPPRRASDPDKPQASAAAQPEQSLQSSALTPTLPRTPSA